MRWLPFTILLACGGDKSAPAPTASGSAEPTAATKVSVPERPSLPGPKPSLPGRSSDAVFSGETRDPEWAADTESGIKQRFEKVRGAKLEATECRQTQCKLTIVGGEGDLAQAIADLEGPRGLHGYAKNIVLSAPAKKSDGTLEMRAFALFDR